MRFSLPLLSKLTQLVFNIDSTVFSDYQFTVSPTSIVYKLHLPITNISSLIIFVSTLSLTRGYLLQTLKMYANATDCCSDTFNSGVILPYTILAISVAAFLIFIGFLCVVFLRRRGRDSRHVRYQHQSNPSRRAKVQDHELAMPPSLPTKVMLKAYLRAKEETLHQNEP